MSCVADNLEKFSLLAFRVKMSKEGSFVWADNRADPTEGAERATASSGPIGTDPFQSH